MADYKGKYMDLVIPTLNVNDTKVTISDIQKENLEYIEEDEMLYCVETSKATEDFFPKYSGYVVLFIEDLDEVEVGKSAGMIFELKEDAETCLAAVNAEKEKAKKLASVNASKKAIAYAEEKGVDIALIQKDGIIKTQDIDEWIANHK